LNKSRWKAHLPHVVFCTTHQHTLQARTHPLSCSLEDSPFISLIPYHPLRPSRTRSRHLKANDISLIISLKDDAINKEPTNPALVVRLQTNKSNSNLSKSK
jgi:hypothetical protein